MCDGIYDCPQTENTDGGDDEDDCEGDDIFYTAACMLAYVATVGSI